MTKFASSLFALVVPALILAGPAYAQQKDSKPAKPAAKAKTEAKTPAKGKAAEKPAPGQGQALLLETSGKWQAYATQAQGKARICYALGKAAERKPANLKDVPGYLFISTRPGEGVKNEISFVMNFALKEEVEHQASIGEQSFVLVAKGQNLWLKNPAEEARVLDAMRKGSTLEIKATSKRGNATADKYLLSGVSQTVKRAEDACK